MRGINFYPFETDIRKKSVCNLRRTQSVSVVKANHLTVLRTVVIISLRTVTNSDTLQELSF